MSVGSSPGLTDRSFRFLADLDANNDATWFNANKALFQETLQEPFARLLDELSTRLADSEVPLKGSRTTMFRMNRDVRFSADKSPYKTAVSGLLTPSGTKAEDAGLVYLHLGADGGFVAAGLHSPTPKRLGPVRDRILDALEEFDAVVQHLNDAHLDLDLDTGGSLKTMPRGYAEHSQHRLAWALRLSALITQQRLPKSAWTNGDIVDRVERVTLAAGPLLAFVRPTAPPTPT